MDQPKVSVVVPIYNVEKYLEECLDSLAQQSLDSIEVVMVDDGSTDSSAEIAQRYAADYPGFVYFRKSNGGLGQTRNYGADRATGEYLCFCDSDDTIPKYAYEHLYDLAKKYDCDFVTGDMQRFNARGASASSLHRIAYRNACELMNVRTHPELLFDSTTPNKLFKRSFFLESDLRFPEGMLYEDIPVNTPIFCITEKYAHLDEIVYNWRVREKGEERSITQRRAEWSNFRDRFRAMKMVDDYFEEHVKDQELVNAKDFKWLRLDLRIYIDLFCSVDSDYQEDFLNAIAPYLAKIDESVFDQLDVAERVKYYYFRECELDKLMQFISYSKSAAYKSFPIIEENGRYYGKFPFDNLPKRTVDLTDEIERQGCAIKVSHAAFSSQCVSIDGDVFLRALPAKADDDISVEAHLVTAVDGSEVAALPATISNTENPRVDDTHSIKRRTIRRLKREKIRYAVDIPWDLARSLPDGKYLVKMVYRRESIVCPSVFVAWPTEGAAAHPSAHFEGEKRFSFSYDAGERLCFNVASDAVNPIDAIIPEDDELALFSQGERVGSLGLGEIAELSEKGSEEAIKSFPYASPQPIFLPLADRVVKCSASAEGVFEADLLPDGVVAHESSLSGNVFSYRIKELRKGQLDGEWTALLRGIEHEAEYQVPGFLTAAGGTLFCAIDVAEPAFCDNMRADFYRLYLRRKGASVLDELCVYAYTEEGYKNELVNIGRMRYALTDTFYYAGLQVNRPWKWYENSKHRRDVMWRCVYKPIYVAMRKLLPLKKNMVLFDSYWGDQSGCNPGGLYRYIDREHPEFDCRWSLVDEHMKIEGKGKRLRKGSLGYMYALARAKYLVCNVNFENWYVKKKGQIEIQTTHGTPLKKVGFASQGEFTARGLKNFEKRCTRWNYLIAQGPKAEEILADNYRYTKDFLETGLPRNDYLFENNNSDSIAAIRVKYGIPEGRKVILYAPTWRETGKFDLELDLTKIIDALGDEYVIAIRVHHFAASGIQDGAIDRRVVNLTKGASSEECYLLADVLITDYSSLMFDYALLRRPMLFYVYDFEDYRDNLRGFNFDFETEAPGPLLRTTEEVIKALESIEDVIDGYKAAYDAFYDAYCGFEEGNAAEKVFRQVFLNQVG